jgi:arylsulfatase A-like enzyme
VLKWLAGIALALVLLVGTLRSAAPSLIMRYPELLRIIAGIVDPIGPNKDVSWQAGPALPTVSAAERPPNIIVILVDDLGWNDLTWNGGGIANGTVPTPNIDSLANDGVQFTMGYAGNATCAPSRAAIMTGRYPPRFGFESTPAPPAMGRMASLMSNAERPEGEPMTHFHEDRVGDIPPMREQGVPSGEITIAELLRDGGYRTLMFGKWHLGETDGMRPTDQGFDEFLGFYSGAQLFGAEEDPNIVSSKQDFDPIDRFIWKVLPFAVRKDDGPRFTPNGYMTDYLSAEAANAIDANRNRPFFMYLAYNAPHTPLQATKADYDALSHIDDHATRVYAAMIRALDRGVGQVLEALERNGLTDNTLVIFSSDNGGAGYIGLPDINKPYRGWKMTFFEGGLHSPFFMKWPAHLPADTRVETPVSHIDVFSTAAAAAEVPIPGDRVIDGVDLLPFATGEKTGDAHEALFWRSGELQVVLAGRWKYQVDGRQAKRWLFDLAADPTERTNLIEREPDQAQLLQRRLDVQNEDFGPRLFPVLVEGVIATDRTIAEPRIPGEEFTYWPN